MITVLGPKIFWFHVPFTGDRKEIFFLRQSVAGRTQMCEGKQEEEEEEEDEETCGAVGHRKHGRKSTGKRNWIFQPFAALAIHSNVSSATTVEWLPLFISWSQWINWNPTREALSVYKIFTASLITLRKNCTRHPFPIKYSVEELAPRWTVWDSNSGGGEILSTCPYRACSPPNPRPRVTASYQGVNPLGCNANHPPPF